MANTANPSDAESALDLANIRKSLQRMEDSIIFALIERSQYKMNAKVYEPDCEELGPSSRSGAVSPALSLFVGVELPCRCWVAVLRRRAACSVWLHVR